MELMGETRGRNGVKGNVGQSTLGRCTVGV